MADSGAPSAKLQKRDAGDVADASQNEVSVTPVTDASPGSVEAAEAVPQEQRTETTAASGGAANQEKGKKRKVALYVAYIGAGYHVRRMVQHTRLSTRFPYVSIMTASLLVYGTRIMFRWVCCNC